MDLRFFLSTSYRYERLLPATGHVLNDRSRSLKPANLEEQIFFTFSMTFRVLEMLLNWLPIAGFTIFDIIDYLGYTILFLKLVDYLFRNTELRRIYYSILSLGFAVRNSFTSVSPTPARNVLDEHKRAIIHKIGMEQYCLLELDYILDHQLLFL